MKKITVDIARGILEVFVVKRSGDGYLVTLTEFKEGEEPNGVFRVEDKQVIPS